MSFHTSAEYIRVDDNHILRARLSNEDGNFVDAEIDLDQFIGNSNGSFEWGGENFSQSAENVRFNLEGDGSVPVLRGSLRNADGELIDRDLNLGERIGNQNGQFVFV